MVCFASVLDLYFLRKSFSFSNLIQQNWTKLSLMFLFISFFIIPSDHSFCVFDWYSLFIVTLVSNAFSRTSSLVSTTIFLFLIYWFYFLFSSIPLFLECRKKKQAGDSLPPSSGVGHFMHFILSQLLITDYGICSENHSYYIYRISCIIIYLDFLCPKKMLFKKIFLIISRW